MRIGGVCPCRVRRVVCSLLMRCLKTVKLESFEMQVQGGCKVFPNFFFDPLCFAELCSILLFFFFNIYINSFWHTWGMPFSVLFYM